MIKQFGVVRFILVLMIFLHHEGVYSGGGCLAVSAFFILGGICMTLGYGVKVLRDDFSYVAYLKKRAVKFFPLHWVCLLAVLIPILCDGRAFDGHVLLANSLLLQSWVPVGDYYFSFNAVSWYLSDTLFLSLVFPVLYVFLMKISGKERLFALLLLLCLYVIMMFAIPSDLHHAILYINPISRSIDFVIGIFIAEFYKELKGKEKVISFVRNHGGWVDVIMVVSLLMCIGISLLLPGNMFAVYYWPLLSVFFVSVMLLGDTWMDRMMRHELTCILTQCTFSFFLIHLIVINVVKANLPWLEKWGERLVAFAICYLLSQVLYYLVEKKFTQWLIKRL